MRKISAILLFFPVYVFGYAVSTSSPYATRVAIDVLNEGGNAVDALVAASLVIGVANPYKMGIGGGGFFLVSNKGKTYFLNARETAPNSANEKMFLDSYGKPLAHIHQITGPRSVGIPGLVKGLAEVHRKFGRRPWKSLVAPSVEFAKRGVPISADFEKELHYNWSRMDAYEESKKIFGDGYGSYLKAGRSLVQKDLSKFLEHLAKNPNLFYEGKIAKEWISAAKKLGVQIEAKELEKYKTKVDKPIVFKVFGFDGVTAAAPSSSAFVVAGVLRYLEHYYSKKKDLWSADSVERVIVTTETSKLFQELRDKIVGDTPSESLQAYFSRDGRPTEKEKEVWKKIDQAITQKFQEMKNPPKLAGPQPVNSDQQNSHTTHISIVDDKGMVVSSTLTIEAYFGSGMIVPGFGFLLNNELSDFDSIPGGPNTAKPGKRPRSNMSPIILQKSGKAVAVVGCAGGPRIPSAVAGILENFFIFKMNANEAMAFPRIHYGIHEGSSRLLIEKGYPPSTIKKLEELRYPVARVDVMRSTAQALLRNSPKQPWQAASESRYDGLAWATR
ncbi:MAG: gamma-glutamyltransferase family protein [Bacteriovoracia bacterium]